MKSIHSILHMYEILHFLHILNNIYAYETDQYRTNELIQHTIVSAQAL